MSKNYSPSFMVLCNEVAHLIHIASSFTNSAIELEKSSDLSMHLQSFYALVSMAFEVFPKVLIGCEVCEKYQKVKNIDTKEIVKKILNKQALCGHDIKEIFEDRPDMMTALGVQKIIRKPNIRGPKRKEYFVSEYQFKIKGYKYPLSIKDLEGVRYGSFSRKKDVILNATTVARIVLLLKDLQQYCIQKHMESISKLRQVI